MVRVVRLERTVSWSQTRRDTNFAIPGYSISAMIPRRGVKIKFFLSVVIYVVKGDFVPLSAIGENPANAGVARLCGVSPHPIPDTATALPKQARYQLRYTRLLSYSIRLGVFTQSRRATNCATPRYSIKPHYSIMGRFRKAFLVMVKIVGWLQKRVNFRKTETRKPLCRKALRRFQKMGLTKSYYVPNQARYQLRYTRILLILE